MAKILLGDACTSISDGSHNPPGGVEHSEYLMLSSKNIFDDCITYDEPRYLSAESFEIEDKRTRISEGDVLLTIVGTVGRCAVVPTHSRNLTLQRSVAVLKPRKDICGSRYLMYALMAKRVIFENEARGVAQKGIYLKQLAKTVLELHPFTEQERIVETLDKARKLAALHKQQLSALDALIKARFVEMFGGIHNSALYPYLAIENITTVTSGGTPDRSTSAYWDDGTIRWVKTTELHNSIITDTEEKITQFGMESSSAKVIPANSILIAMYGQGKTRGMTGYLAVECTTNQACACILPSLKVNQMYLWHYLILSYDKLRNMAKGGNQPNLNAGIIKKFPILIPPVELQDQFAAFVAQIDKSKFVLL